MSREKALAAIGKAILEEAGNNHDRLEQLFNMSARFAGDNPTLKALTHMLEDAGEDPGWMLRRHQEKRKKNEIE